MANIRDLDKPPIIEAIIDIRVERTKNRITDSFDLLKEKLPKDYSDVEKAVKKEFAFNFKENQEVEPQSKEAVIGFRARKKVGNYIVNFKNDGLTISQLEPYVGWEKFKNEALQLWEIYSSIAGNSEIKRVAVRYVNKINLPTIDPLNFDDYLTSSPKVPEGMENRISNFFTRVATPVIEIGAMAIIIHKLDEPQDGFIPLILDIDVYRLIQGDEDIWTLLDELRNTKNKAFFSSLSDKAMELFK